MPKIPRRRSTVSLYLGNYEDELSRLMNEAMAAQRREDTSGARRFGSGKPRSIQLAEQYDALVEEAEETAVKVTLWALSYREWDELAAEHPPRKPVPAVEADPEKGIEAKPGEPYTVDQLHGVNFETFPDALVLASLADPEETRGQPMSAKIAAGQAVIDDLGDISKLQYRRLQDAAWQVHAGDDSLPKDSLTSLMMQARERSSEQPETEE